MSADGDEDEDGNPLLEQYKFYAGTSGEVSNRRLQTNRFYVSLLSGILVVLPFVFDLDNLTDVRLAAILLIGFVGVALCVLWFLNVWSYKQLNQGKYAVIHEMEQEDEVPYPAYDREWDELDRGENFWTYLEHWKVERVVPWVLAVPYMAMFLFALFNLVA